MTRKMKNYINTFAQFTMAIIVVMASMFGVNSAYATIKSESPITTAPAGVNAAAPAAPRLSAFQVDSLELQKYTYVVTTYDDEPARTFGTKEFCQRAGAVIFPVNKTVINPGNAFLNELRTEILPLMESQNLELYRIDVRGAASPEGSVENNHRLAVGRANVLRDSITNILPSATGDIINLSSVNEDYELLIHYMEEAGDPDAALVRKLVNKWSNSPKDLKWALFTAKNRTLWKKLLKDYFPQLRATRVILHFRVATPSEPEKVVPPCQCAGGTECICLANGQPCQCGKDDGCRCKSHDDSKCQCAQTTTHPCKCGSEMTDSCTCRQHDESICRCTSDPNSLCSGTGTNPCRCMTDSTTCRCALNDSIGCHCLSTTEIVVPDTTVVEEPIPHRRPFMAMSTNVLYDVFYMPDYGFAPMWNGKAEFYFYNDRFPFWNHTSLNLGFINPYWHNWNAHKFFQIRNYEVEGRWYSHFEPETGQRYGWYLGAAIDANKFGIGLSDMRGWQGEGVGLQVTGGYVVPLNKCKSWKLEVNLGAGFYETHYDPYMYDDPFPNGDINGGHGEYDPPTFDPSGDKLHYYYKWFGAAKDFKKRQYRYRWLGPTQIGVSIKYDLLWKRSPRRGVSFRHRPKRKEVKNE